MLYLLCTGVTNQYTIILIQHICMNSQVSVNYLINPGIPGLNMIPIPESRDWIKAPGLRPLILTEYTIDISKMVAQCYDGAVDTREYQHDSKK